MFGQQQSGFHRRPDVIHTKCSVEAGESGLYREAPFPASVGSGLSRRVQTHNLPIAHY